MKKKWFASNLNTKYTMLAQVHNFSYKKKNKQNDRIKFQNSSVKCVVVPNITRKDLHGFKAFIYLMIQGT